MLKYVSLALALALVVGSPTFVLAGPGDPFNGLDVYLIDKSTNCAVMLSVPIGGSSIEITEFNLASPMGWFDTGGFDYSWLPEGTITFFEISPYKFHWRLEPTKAAATGVLMNPGDELAIGAFYDSSTIDPGIDLTFFDAITATQYSVAPENFTLVPEPSTFAMLLLGAAAFSGSALWRRRRWA